ncbi:MAG: LppX_LprAFG lipoprotein [Micromonosporaceae bacterium]|nr:LppX_LprAFG lipoprotein [Micromonosporaceae bacterium]
MSRPLRGHFVRSLLPLVASLLLVPGLLAACTKDKDGNEASGESLPDGATLLTESASAMTDVETVHIVLDINPAVGALPITRAEGDLKRGGDAKGAIQLLAGAQLLEVEFVVMGDNAWLKYPTGGWRAAGSITAIYDPSAILDPQRGVANLLSTSSNARTEGAEKVNGVDAWRVAVDIDQKAANMLVPGVPKGLTGTVWIDQDTKRMVKAVVNSPQSGSTPASTITLDMTNFNTAVDVSAPV